MIADTQAQLNEALAELFRRIKADEKALEKKQGQAPRASRPEPQSPCA